MSSTPSLPPRPVPTQDAAFPPPTDRPAPPYNPSSAYSFATPPAQPNGLPHNVQVISGWARLGCCLLELVLRVATLQLGWLIWALMLADRGQTPAKQLLGYRVVHAETFRTVGLGRMFFMRFLIGGIVAAFAIVCSLGVLLFMPFWDKRRQNLWDKVSNTLVINVNPTGLR